MSKVILCFVANSWPAWDTRFPPKKINQPLQLGVTENVLSVKIMSTLSKVKSFQGTLGPGMVGVITVSPMMRKPLFILIDRGAH